MSHASEAQGRALGLALSANVVFLAVEVLGGLVFRSLALLADAAHMTSDVAGLTIALAASRLAMRPATPRHSYGLQRAEVLGAQANGLLLLGAATWIAVEAFRRLGEPAAVQGTGVLVVAVGGLVVNVASAWLLSRVQGESLNVRAAMLHMASDALGSVGAIVAGLAVVVWAANWMDSVVSVVIAALVVWSAWRLLRDTTHVLLEGTPRTIDPVEVESALAAQPGVEAVHHLHLWNLASDVPALSAHVVLAGEVSLHDAQDQGDRLKAMLVNRFGITHSTLELECHHCEPGR